MPCFWNVLVIRITVLSILFHILFKLCEMFTKFCSIPALFIPRVKNSVYFILNMPKQMFYDFSFSIFYFCFGRFHFTGHYLLLRLIFIAGYHSFTLFIACALDLILAPPTVCTVISVLLPVIFMSVYTFAGEYFTRWTCKLVSF